jgi:hypothetical protein
MRVILILLILVQPLFASEIIAVFDMPANSRYKLVPINAKIRPAIMEEKKEVVNIVQVPQETLILSGVFKVANGYSALINGEPYKVNDTVAGYKIKKIDINSAILIKKGKKVTIYVENN